MFVEVGRLVEWRRCADCETPSWRRWCQWAIWPPDSRPWCSSRWTGRCVVRIQSRRRTPVHRHVPFATECSCCCCKIQNRINKLTVILRHVFSRSTCPHWQQKLPKTATTCSRSYSRRKRPKRQHFVAVFGDKCCRKQRLCCRFRQHLLPFLGRFWQLLLPVWTGYNTAATMLSLLLPHLYVKWRRQLFVRGTARHLSR